MPPTSAPPNLADDLDDLLDSPASLPGPKCTMAKVLGKIGEDDPDLAGRLLALIDNDEVSGSKIAGVLGKHGHDVDGQQVRRHRNRSTGRGCKCPR